MQKIFHCLWIAKYAFSFYWNCISAYTVNAIESTALDTLLLTLVVTDNDADAVITFAPETSVPSVFVLSETDGTIRLVDQLDRETTTDYEFNVEATDGSTIVTATVSIIVDDDNDNIPVFNPTNYK